MENYFTHLSSVNVNDKAEKKNNLTYLSWAWAWAEFKKICPYATYTVLKFDNNLPYVYDEKTGYMVFTTVTIDDLTHEMWLPVMDGANKPMKKDEYIYKDRYGKEKTCNACDMFDINKTIMRCLTKNLAMFGLGLYIYAGEDLPEDEKPTTVSEPPSGLDIQVLIGLCTSAKMDVARITATYKVKTLNELTRENYADAIVKLNNILTAKA